MESPENALNDCGKTDALSRGQKKSEHELGVKEEPGNGFMKTGSRCTNIGTQERTKVTE